MIEALISGRMHGKAIQRTGTGGKVFVTAKVRVAMNDAEAIFISVAAYSDTAQQALAALDAGDAVAIAGTLKITTWTTKDGSARPGADMVAHVVTTIYATRKKRAAQAKPAPVAPGAEMPYDEIP